MKKICSIILACFLLVSTVMPAMVFADDLWDSELSRAMDSTDTMSAEELKSIDDAVTELLETWHVDCGVAIIHDERLGDSTMEDFARGLYESCRFGYGDTKDGYMCLYLNESEKLAIVPMGGAADYLDESYLEWMNGVVCGFREKYDLYGIMYGCVRCISSGMEDRAEADSSAAEETEATAEIKPGTEPAAEESSMANETAVFEGVVDARGIARYGEGQDKPAWYPVDPENFPFYSDSEAARIVDGAGLFTDEAEAAMEKRIAEISSASGKDIVVVTDTSDYGLGHDIYAADFYDFNGYGIGPESEGLCLFICMDPENRGGWTCATGTQTREIFTSVNANRLDDVLYDYLGKGEYEEGVADWIENVGDFYQTGLALAPEWYPAGGVVPAGYRNPEAPIVLDEAEMMTEEEIRHLTETLTSIREEKGLNVYCHTTRDELGMSRRAYNSFYYTCMGYEPDGLLLSIIALQDGGTRIYLDVSGSAEDQIPKKYRGRIEDRAYGESGAYAQAARASQLLQGYLKTGRVPRSTWYWMILTAVGAFFGLIYGKISLDNAERQMDKPQTRNTAYIYVDAGKTVVRRLRERFLYTRSTYVILEDPKPSRSSSGSSGSSKSTYKSSYSGSSGRSHSGSGRKF